MSLTIPSGRLEMDLCHIGEYEQHAFGGPLPKKSDDPGWDKWVTMREKWWEDWAKDTVKYIRAIDSDKSHEVYLEDFIGSVVDPNRPNNVGLDFARVARYFDAVGGYTMSNWNVTLRIRTRKL